MVYDESVGVFGATSLVGEFLLEGLCSSGIKVIAFSRRSNSNTTGVVEWRQIDAAMRSENNETISNWICIAPVWVLPDYFDLLEAYGAKKVVALSSTSRYSKVDSSDSNEQLVVNRLADGEIQLQAWAEARGIDWVVLRPTLIYGLRKDKNVTDILLFILRWGFFPILGKGSGLRQPVHAEDVANACHSAMTTPTVRNRAYNISGAETLSYKEMVKRIFVHLDRKPHFAHLPRWIFQFAISILRLLPRFRHWSVVMADRMDLDMVFDHSDASQDFNFLPRSFTIE